jgi:hypothetical protein
VEHLARQLALMQSCEGAYVVAATTGVTTKDTSTDTRRVVSTIAAGTEEYMVEEGMVVWGGGGCLGR